MARVTLVCLYDNWAMGLRALSNALLREQHSVSIVHLKLPAKKNNPFFLDHPINYENHHSRQDAGGFSVASYNVDADMWTRNELYLLQDAIQSTKPDIIGISNRSTYEVFLPQLAEVLANFPNAITVAGGFGPTLNPHAYFQYFDFLCIGEGEETLVALANRCPASKDAADIPNLAYLLNGEPHFTHMVPPDCSKDYMHGCDWHLVTHYFIENNTLTENSSFLSWPGIEKDYYTMIGRGCLGKCAFCAVGNFHDTYKNKGVEFKLRRCREVESILLELEQAKRYGFSKIVFMDSFFAAKTAYILDFFKQYQQRIGLPFFAQLLPTQALDNREIIDAALAAGLNHTVIGFQSPSMEINTEIYRRKTDHAQAIELAQIFNRTGQVLIDYHIITHNPFEGEEVFKQGLALIDALPKENGQLVLQRLCPFPGTLLHEMIQDKHPAFNLDEKHRQFIFYLAKYNFTDTVFNKFLFEYRQASVADTITAYNALAFCNDESAARPINDQFVHLRLPLVSFINSQSGYNIFSVDGKYVALNQIIGPFDFNKTRAWETDNIPYGILVATSLDEIHCKVNEASSLNQRLLGPPVEFVKEYGSYNILKIGDRHVAVSHSLGPIEFSREHIWEKDLSAKSIFSSNSLESLLQKMAKVQS